MMASYLTGFLSPMVAEPSALAPWLPGVFDHMPTMVMAKAIEAMITHAVIARCVVMETSFHTTVKIRGHWNRTKGSTTSLPALIDRAASALASARTAAEVLDARDMASVAYDAAKKAARFHKAKQAHDDLLAAAYRAQADALEIEAGAKRRLADEYDAAQERGEVATVGKRSQRERLTEAPPSAADIGLSRKDIHEARIIATGKSPSPASFGARRCR